MIKEFVTYEQALSLKELGFDEPCLGNFADDEKHTLFTNGNRPGKTNAPMFSQAFRWFREKYGYLANIHNFDGNFKATLSGSWFNWSGCRKKTYEEAELACLIKLIEICKKNNMENKIPTAEEFFKEKYGSNDRIAIDNAILLSKEFTKLHVEAALKEAAYNAEISDYDEHMQFAPNIDENSILNAYPLTNIK